MPIRRGGDEAVMEGNAGVSWSRVLSVVLPTTAALVCGVFIGKEIAGSDLVIQRGMYWDNLQQIEQAALRGDDKAVLSTIRDIRQSIERSSRGR